MPQDLFASDKEQPISSNSQSVQELDGFLLVALRNQKDRQFLLQLDDDLERFVKDDQRQRLEFPPLNSYHRLIVHRVAQYFKMAHVVDSVQNSMTLFKTPTTALPLLRFEDLVDKDMIFEDSPASSPSISDESLLATKASKPRRSKYQDSNFHTVVDPFSAVSFMPYSQHTNSSRRIQSAYYYPHQQHYMYYQHPPPLPYYYHHNYYPQIAQSIQSKVDSASALDGMENLSPVVEPTSESKAIDKPSSHNHQAKRQGSLGIQAETQSFAQVQQHYWQPPQSMVDEFQAMSMQSKPPMTTNKSNQKKYDLLHDYDKIESYQGVRLDKNQEVSTKHILQVRLIDANLSDKYKQLAKCHDFRVKQYCENILLLIFTGSSAVEKFVIEHQNLPDGAHGELSRFDPKVDTSMKIPPVKRRHRRHNHIISRPLGKSRSEE